MNPVGADHGIGLGCRPIGKEQRHRAAVLLQPNQLLVQMDDLGRDDRGQRFVQVGAVHAQEWRAVKVFRHRQFALELAGVADPIEMGERRKGALTQPVLDADAAQDLHRIRQHLNAGADPAELMRLFVDRNVKACLPKRAGSRHAAHSGADDCNFWGGHAFCRSLMLKVPFLRSPF